MYGENFDPTLAENPRIGSHFGFMQIKTLKLKHVKPCANKNVLGNNTLDIQSRPYSKSMLKGMYGENS